jgi:hypothetical protein
MAGGEYRKVSWKGSINHKGDVEEGVNPWGSV